MVGNGGDEDWDEENYTGQEEAGQRPSEEALPGEAQRPNEGFAIQSDSRNNQEEYCQDQRVDRRQDDKLEQEAATGVAGKEGLQSHRQKKAGCKYEQVENERGQNQMPPGTQERPVTAG